MKGHPYPEQMIKRDHLDKYIIFIHRDNVYAGTVREFSPNDEYVKIAGRWYKWEEVRLGDVIERPVTPTNLRHALVEIANLQGTHYEISHRAKSIARKALEGRGHTSPEPDLG